MDVEQFAVLVGNTRGYGVEAYNVLYRLVNLPLADKFVGGGTEKVICRGEWQCAYGMAKIRHVDIAGGHGHLRRDVGGRREKYGI